MIKEKEIIINGHSSNYKYYISLGYDVIVRKPFSIKTKDLMAGSVVVITTICDECKRETKNAFKDYYIYTNGLKDNFYCNKCKSIKSKKTCIDKYGVDNPMKSQEVKDILKNSLLEKYGVDHYSKTDEYKEKYKNTCLEKFGVDSPLKSDLIKNKIIKTNIKNTGFPYPMQSNIIKDKSKKTCQDKYNTDTYSQTEGCKEEIRNTNLEKFGVDSYSKTNEYKIKVKETNLGKYGVESYTQTEEYKIQTKNTNLEKFGVEHYSKTDEFKSIVKIKREGLTKLRYEYLIGEDFNIIEYNNKNFNIKHVICNKEFLISRDALYGRLYNDMCLCTECHPINSQHSNMELELQDFLNIHNINYEVGNKKILSGKELDIYIPDFNLAIEMNGIYWHSEIYLEKDYHVNKTNICKEKGIQLLHIWEDDWKYKRNIIKSIILNRLGLLKEKIFARKCIIKEVNPADTRLFLDNNHIQGFSNSQLKLGLYYNEELVSLMTLGWRYINGKKEYELIRFCNKINFSVIGAASKLFSYFIKTNNIQEIISYADISLFEGELYNKLGFIKSHLSKPNYFWIVDGIRKHRFNYNKQKLIKEGFDPNKTEVEIMHERGCYRIFSCGQEKWVYKK